MDLKARRFHFLCAVFSCAILVAGSLPSFGGAGILFESLNQTRGFNFTKETKVPVGFVKLLKIGTNEIKADLPLREPNKLAVSSRELLSYVGVLSKIKWGGNQNDPFEFTVHVSAANKDRISKLIPQLALGNINLDFSFMVWDFDRATRKHFQSFYGGTRDSEYTVLKGFLAREGKVLKIQIGEKGKVASPENWPLSITVVPQSQEQNVTFALLLTNGSMHKVVKKWGGASPKK